MRHRFLIGMLLALLVVSPVFSFHEDYRKGENQVRLALQQHKTGDFLSAQRTMTEALHLLDKNYYVWRKVSIVTRRYSDSRPLPGYSEDRIQDIASRVHLYAMLETSCSKPIQLKELQAWIKTNRKFLNVAVYKEAANFADAYCDLESLENTMATLSTGASEKLDGLIEKYVHRGQPGAMFPLLRVCLHYARKTKHKNDQIRVTSLVSAALSRWPKNTTLKELAKEINEWPRDTIDNRTFAKNLAFGKKMVDQANYKVAFVNLRDCHQRKPDDTALALLFAKVCLKVGQKEQAGNITKQVLAREPKNREALELLQDATNSWESRLRNGHKLLRANNFKKAAMVFKLLYSERPSEIEIICGLAESYAKSGFKDKALLVIKQGLVQNPDNEKLQKLMVSLR